MPAYWMDSANGAVLAFGGAGSFGSASGLRLNKPIVGMAPTPDGQGYWLDASDGGVFAYGDAGFHGSAGALRLNKPVVGMAATTRRQGLLARGRRRRDLRVRRRRLPRLHGCHEAQQAGRRHGTDPRRQGLLARSV